MTVVPAQAIATPHAVVDRARADKPPSQSDQVDASRRLNLASPGASPAFSMAPSRRRTSSTVSTAGIRLRIAGLSSSSIQGRSTSLHLAIEVEERRESLPMRRRRDMVISREMREKALDLRG
jgi:hypothetical protein